MPPKVVVRAATARELRRAFGPRAADALNSHADAIEALNAQVGAQDTSQKEVLREIIRAHQRITELESEKANLALRLEAVESAVHALMAERAASANLSFVGRCAWLFLGR